MSASIAEIYEIDAKRDQEKIDLNKKEHRRNGWLFILFGILAVIGAVALGIYMPTMTEAFFVSAVSSEGILAAIALIFYALMRNNESEVHRWQAHKERDQEMAREARANGDSY